MIGGWGGSIKQKGDVYKELYQGRVAKGLHDLQAFIRAN